MRSLPPAQMALEVDTTEAALAPLRQARRRLPPALRRVERRRARGGAAKEAARGAVGCRLGRPERQHQRRGIVRNVLAKTRRDRSSSSTSTDGAGAPPTRCPWSSPSYASAAPVRAAVRAAGRTQAGALAPCPPRPDRPGSTPWCRRDEPRRPHAGSGADRARATGAGARAGTLDRRHRTVARVRLPGGAPRPLAGARGPRAGNLGGTRRRGQGSAAPGVAGILVLETPFLLGGFIALLAVRPELAGADRARAGRESRQRIFVAGGKRWLYVSPTAATARRWPSIASWASRAWDGCPT